MFGGHRGCTGYNCFGGSNELTQIDTESGVCTRLDAGANVTGIPPNPRNGMGFAAWDGVLYVFGGTAKDMSSSVHSYVSNELHSYHIGEKAWLKLDRSANVTGVEPGARRLMGFAANSASLWVAFGRGNWHACSGCPDSNMIGDAFRFEIGTRRWSALSSVSEARFELSLAALGSMLFAFGGRRSVYDSTDNGSNEMLALDVGDPDNGWAMLSSQGDIPAARENAGLAAVGGKLVLFGGRGGGYFNDVHLLRPSTSTWTKVTAFTGEAPSARRFFGNLAVSGCSCFVFGGYDGSRSDQLFRFEVAPEPDEDGTCQPAGAATTAASTRQLSTPAPATSTSIGTT
ncbi:MAG: Kelch repeat-containing protein, partial [Promethearchaeia archaeon]